MENTQATIEYISKKVDLLTSLISASHNKGRSENINELAAALAKAQSGMEIAVQADTNPHFKSKYADLASIVRASRPFLTANGLSVVQQILVQDDGQSMLHTILMHSSGQWIESKIRIIPLKENIQAFGSCLTYLRRYSYASLVGVTAGDEDDDGEVAMKPVRSEQEKGTSLNTRYNPSKEGYEPISKDQLDELEYELEGYPDLAEQIMNHLSIQSLADIPKSRYRVCMERVRTIKLTRTGEKKSN